MSEQTGYSTETMKLMQELDKAHLTPDEARSLIAETGDRLLADESLTNGSSRHEAANYVLQLFDAQARLEEQLVLRRMEHELGDFRWGREVSSNTYTKIGGHALRIDAMTKQYNDAQYVAREITMGISDEDTHAVYWPWAQHISAGQAAANTHLAEAYRNRQISAES